MAGKADDGMIDFWDSMTLEELAHAQGIEPCTSIDSFLMVWDGEEDVFEGFAEALDELRHPERYVTG